MVCTCMHMHACIIGHILRYGMCVTQIKSNVDLGKYVCVMYFIEIVDPSGI